MPAKRTSRRTLVSSRRRAGAGRRNEQGADRLRKSLAFVEEVEAVRFSRLWGLKIGLSLTLLLHFANAASEDEPSREASPRGTTQAALTIGDVAPPLHIDRWLRGSPIKRFERGTVYVLDFWAPWCAPCVALMPHLSSIQDELASRGVRIIALVGPDTAGTTLHAVESFLARRRDQVRMTVAYDALEGRAEPALDVFKGRTTASYLERARLDGIPVAFVIDGEGRVAWIGQPPELLAILHAVVSGKWDMTGAAERYRAARTAEPRLEDLKTHLSKGRVPEAMAEARALVEGPFASESGYLRALASAMAASAQRGSKGVDLDLALAAIRRAEELSEGADPTVLVTLARVRFLRGEIEQAIDAQ